MFRAVKANPKAVAHYKAIDDELGDKVYGGKPPAGKAGTREYQVKAGLRAEYATDPTNRPPTASSSPQEIKEYQRKREIWVDVKYNKIKGNKEAEDGFIAKHETAAQGLEASRKAQGIPTITDIIPDFWKTGTPKDYKTPAPAPKPKPADEDGHGLAAGGSPPPKAADGGPPTGM